MAIYTCMGKFPGDKLSQTEKEKRLYHYTTFDTFVKIWLSKRLKFSGVTNVNDIQEAESISTAANNWNQIAVVYAYNQIRKEYKQISFTMDFDSYMQGSMSPMLWGHYGDKRRGVCIEFDKSKLNIPKSCFAHQIAYKKYLNKNRLIDNSVSTIKQIHSYIKRNKKDIFFTKQLCWKGENEYRIISRDNEYLDIGDAITAVYLTSYNSPECLLVEQLVGGAIPVKYLHYIPSAKKGLAIPVLSETKKTREQMEGIPTKNSYDWLNIAKEKFDSCRKDENASLIVDETLLWQQKN